MDPRNHRHGVKPYRDGGEANIRNRNLPLRYFVWVALGRIAVGASLAKTGHNPYARSPDREAHRGGPYERANGQAPKRKFILSPPTLYSEDSDYEQEYDYELGENQDKNTLSSQPITSFLQHHSGQDVTRSGPPPSLCPWPPLYFGVRRLDGALDGNTHTVGLIQSGAPREPRRPRQRGLTRGAPHSKKGRSSGTWG